MGPKTAGLRIRQHPRGFQCNAPLPPSSVTIVLKLRLLPHCVFPCVAITTRNAKIDARMSCSRRWAAALPSHATARSASQSHHRGRREHFDALRAGAVRGPHHRLPMQKRAPKKEKKSGHLQTCATTFFTSQICASDRSAIARRDLAFQSNKRLSQEIHGWIKARILSDFWDFLTQIYQRRT